VQENQGAQQGAPVRENIKVEDVFDRDEESDDDEYDDVRENIKVEDVLDDDEESDDANLMMIQRMNRTHAKNNTIKGQSILILRMKMTMDGVSETRKPHFRFYKLALKT